MRRYVKNYNKFRGVDFSTDPALIDDSRTPYSQNLISDAGGFPEKRLGWATMATFQTPITLAAEQINGFHKLVDGSSNPYYLVHHKNKLTKLALNVDDTIDWDGSHTELSTGFADSRSSWFAFKNILYILDGTNYWSYNGTTLANVEIDNTANPATTTTFIPTTTINSPPGGGGTSFEAVNLLSPWRTNTFIGNGAAQDFYVDTGSIDNATTLLVYVGGVLKTVTTDYTVNFGTGVISFGVAPADGAGVANVLITFAKTVSGAADKINGCRFSMWYGAGEFSRVFVSGNAAYRNYDWYSGLYDPTYFPDTNYTIVGSSASAIMGYLRQYDNMLIVKEDNNQDATLFVRTANLSDTGVITFPVKQGSAGIGAVSMYAFGSLRDEPLFLAREGVYTPTLNYGSANQERSMQNRSYYINSVLTDEATMENAVATTWNGYYVLSVNGHCYVADSRQKTSKSSTEGTSYEWYYWTNVAARTMFVIDDLLYFGTTTGALCKFRSDEGTALKWNDDTTAIDAYWGTKLDDDGDFMLLKTMERLGSGVMLKPYSSSSISISVMTESEASLLLNSKTLAPTFDFTNMDFDNFSFETSDVPDVLPFNLKVKNYRALQIIARNNAVNQGFGIYGFIKRYHPVKNVR